MIVAMAQINPIIADFDGNLSIILNYCVEARSRGADIILFPELSLCGYPPMDLLNRHSFLAEGRRALERLRRSMPSGLAAIVGHIEECPPNDRGKALQNVASVLLDGRRIHRQAKTLLPTYDVFDEARYFEPARASRLFDYRSKRIGIAICEDLWHRDVVLQATDIPHYLPDPVGELLKQGAHLLLTPAASPFHSGKLTDRLALVARSGKLAGVPTVYVNCVGGNDSLIFDGHSMVTDATGRLICLADGFREQLLIVDLDRTPQILPTLPDRRFAAIEQALLLGIRDYLRKTGFRQAVVALSGGIDSAVVATVAVRALGAHNVRALLLPSRFSSSGSIDDATELARRLQIETFTIPIHDIVATLERSLAPIFAGAPPDVTEENLQARVRGTLLMAYSNKFGALPLTTGNKSELAVGYCTLYGDMSGGLAVIGDLFKTEVYQLARHLNRAEEIIPETILTKAPSAELRPDQRDADSLPPYDLLDTILTRLIIDDEPLEEIVRAGIDPDVVRSVVALVDRSEYKRQQAPPVLKVSRRAFGSGRRMPIARALH